MIFDNYIPLHQEMINTSSMGGTEESSSPDTCQRQNFVGHEYFVPKWHLPGEKTHLWSCPEINNNKRTHNWDPGKLHLWFWPKKNNWDPAFYNQTQIWVLMILSKPVKSKLKRRKRTSTLKLDLENWRKYLIMNARGKVYILKHLIQLHNW